MNEYNWKDGVFGDFFDGLIFKIESKGVAVDLTGARVDIHFKDAKDVIRKKYSSANGTITIDGAAGKFTVLPHKITTPVGLYNYDTQITFSNGKVKSWVKGTWEITKAITDVKRR